MAISKKQLIDDIILRITKGAPSDDFELSPRQIAFWFDLTARAIVPKYLESKLSSNEPISPIMIQIEDDLVGVVENVTMLDQYNDRVYIQTSKQIIDLSDDSGILRVITEEGQKIDRVPIERLDTLNSMTFSKPSRDNMLYSRVYNRLYIHGLSPKHVGIITFSVTYIPKVELASLTNSDDVRLPDEVIGLISDEVEKIARRQMLGIADIENDAEDDNQVQ